MIDAMPLGALPKQSARRIEEIVANGADEIAAVDALQVLFEEHFGGDQ